MSITYRKLWGMIEDMPDSMMDNVVECYDVANDGSCEVIAIGDDDGSLPFDAVGEYTLIIE